MSDDASVRVSVTIDVRGSAVTVNGSELARISGDAAKWTLAVVVEGLALWVNRGTHIDVLFPDDGLGADSERHHYVTWQQNAKGPEIPMQGKFLDLSGLGGSVGQTSLTLPLGWLPISVEKGSVAEAADAPFVGTHMVASLRLPAGAIYSLDQGSLGSFTRSDGTPIELGYGLLWTMTVQRPQKLDGELFTFKDPASVAFGLHDAGGATELRIRCLSHYDRTTDDPIVVGDRLTETQFIGYLSSKGGTKLADVQTCVQVPKSANPFSNSGMPVRPSRPCPPSAAQPF
jgi:hypothetical protein